MKKNTVAFETAIKNPFASYFRLIVLKTITTLTKDLLHISFK